MNDESFSVVIKGMAEGQKPGEVKKKLATAFNKRPEEMDIFFRDKPMVVKRGLDRDTALKYKKVIEKTGAICKIQVSRPPGPTPKEPAKIQKIEKLIPPKKMVCPNCGLEQEEASSCKKCGILVQRAIAAQERHAGNMNQYYEPSGAVGPLGPVFIIVFGLAASLIAGVIYGYAVFYLPFIYLNALLTLLCGLAVGYAVGSGGKIGHVRSKSVLMLFGIMFGIMAEYAGWTGWIFALSGHRILALSPGQIGAVISATAAEGAWSIFGWVPKGTWLYLFWALEAVLITGSAAAAAMSRLSATPYCEICRKWVEEKTVIMPLDPAPLPQEFRSRLELGDYSSLLELKKKDNQDGDYSKIELSYCPGCRQLHLLSVLAVKGGKEGKKKKSATEDFIVQNLVISRHDFDFIQEFWKQ